MKGRSVDTSGLDGGGIHGAGGDSGWFPLLHRGSGVPPGPASIGTQSSSPQGRRCLTFQLCTLLPLVDVGVHGQLNPHKLPWYRTAGTGWGAQQEDKGGQGTAHPRPRTTPPARAAPAPLAEGPACPRGRPSAALPLCLPGGRGGACEKFWAKKPPFCCQPSPTSGAAVRRAGLRTRPPHKGSSSSAPLRR